MALPTDPTGRPASWLPDPYTRGSYRRYWDGTTWTDFTSPPDGPPLPPFGDDGGDQGHDDPAKSGAAVGRAADDPVAAAVMALEAAEDPPTGSPGWHADPVTEGDYERWWDGRGWLDATYPPGGPIVGREVTRDPLPGDPPAPEPTHPHWGLWVAAGLGAVWVMIGLTAWGRLPSESALSFVGDGLLNPLTWAMVAGGVVASRRADHAPAWTWVTGVSLAALPCLAYATHVL